MLHTIQIQDLNPITRKYSINRNILNIPCNLELPRNNAQKAVIQGGLSLENFQELECISGIQHIFYSRRHIEITIREIHSWIEDGIDHEVLQILISIYPTNQGNINIQYLQPEPTFQRLLQVTPLR